MLRGLKTSGLNVEAFVISLEADPEANSPEMVCGLHKIIRDPGPYYPQPLTLVLLIRDSCWNSSYLI